MSDGDDRKAQIEEVTLNPKTPKSVQEEAIKTEQQSARRGSYLGFLIIVLGAVACYLGLSGTVDLQLGIPGLSAKAQQATPGVVLMLIGLVITVAARPKIK